MEPDRWQAMIHFLGIDSAQTSRAEKLASTFGGAIGILLIALISYHTTGAQGAAMIVPSMGASAVLLFAVPHGKLSQPWALVGGNLVSAVIGVTCYRTVPDTFAAAALAVGLAIGVMHLLRCIHPPGGATALAAVIGGPGIHALGYGYVLTPILLNVAVIFCVALIFNGLFPWRRYPVSLMRFSDAGQQLSRDHARLLDKRFIEKALEEMDLVVDVTSDELQRLFALTLDQAEGHRLKSADILLGHYYTNGRHGMDWCVRQILDEAPSPRGDHDMVVYRVVEGPGRGSADSCTRAEFARWAAREVTPTRR